MSTAKQEIAALEERLRLAELGPDPDFFKEVLADDAVMATEGGKPSMAKKKVVEAHQPGKGPKFTSIEMKNLEIVDPLYGGGCHPAGQIRRPKCVSG
jgi:hypothetical protein